MQLYITILASAPCRAVLLFLQVINLKPEMITLDVREGEQLSPEFLKINPQHTVPTIVDDGFVLSESRAILGYLAEKYAPNTTYYPSDPMARGLVNQRLMFDLGYLFPRFYNTYVKRMFMGEKGLDDADVASLNEAMMWLEMFIGDAPYMAGDKITIADYSIIVTISTLTVLELDMTPYPKISAWYGKCKMEMQGYKEIDWKGAEMLGGIIKMQLGI